MAPPGQVTQWLDKHYPKPRVDPEWLKDCCQWLEENQNISPVTAFPEFMEHVKEQLLQSDLKDSMLCNTGLRPGINQATEKLQGPPLLVQIIAITEIGVSAFQLEQTRAVREERIRSGVGNIEGEEDGDVEVEGEGPMPKYPRGTLRFQLSDGMTVIDAMEYRPLPQLALGITELGYKMQLQGTRIQKGMAFLEPATVRLLGGRCEELEAGQLTNFKRGLRTRLGKPLSPEPGPALEDPPEPPAAAQATRSPLREISPPPVPDFAQQHTDDVDMEPRRRIPAGSSLAKPSASATHGSTQARPIAALPSRHARTSSGNNVDDGQETVTDMRTTHAQRATLAYAGAKNATASRYFDAAGIKEGENVNQSRKARDLAINAALQDLDFAFTPTPGQLLRAIPSPPSPSAERLGGPVKNSSFDFELLDELGADENQMPPTRNGKGKAPEQQQPLFLPDTPPAQAQAADTGSDDYGMADDDFGDADFWENVDKVMGKAAVDTSSDLSKNPPSSASGNASASSSSMPSSYIMVDKQPAEKKSGLSAGHIAGPTPSNSSRLPADIIEIDDSDEDMGDTEDKENQPVPARHVRQRMNNDRQERNSSFGGAMPTLSQRTGRPIVQATRADDVIELSDSD